MFQLLLGMIRKFVTVGVGHVTDRQSLLNKTKNKVIFRVCAYLFRNAFRCTQSNSALLGLRERGRTNTGSYTTPTISCVCCALSAPSCSTGHIMASVRTRRGIERKKRRFQFRNNEARPEIGFPHNMWKAYLGCDCITCNRKWLREIHQPNFCL